MVVLGQTSMHVANALRSITDSKVQGLCSEHSIIMSLPTTNGGSIMFCGRPSGRLAIDC